MALGGRNVKLCTKNRRHCEKSVDELFPKLSAVHLRGRKDRHIGATKPNKCRSDCCSNVASCTCGDGGRHQPREKGLVSDVGLRLW